MGTGVSPLATIVLLLVGAIFWIVGVLVKQVLTNEVDWWAPRLEALLARFAALLAPRSSDRKTLRDTWLADLDCDRAPGTTRVLKAGALFVAAIDMWRRPPQDDEAPVDEIVAADGMTMTDAAVVSEKGGESTSVTVRLRNTGSDVVRVRAPVNYQRTVVETLPSGDLWTHSTSKGDHDGDTQIVNFVDEYASADNGIGRLGSGVVGMPPGFMEPLSALGAGRGGVVVGLGPPGLSAQGVVRVSGSASFHSDAMVRLRTGDYPVANRALYH